MIVCFEQRSSLEPRDVGTMGGVREFDGETLAGGLILCFLVNILIELKK